MFSHPCETIATPISEKWKHKTYFKKNIDVLWKMLYNENVLE